DRLRTRLRSLPARGASVAMPGSLTTERRRRVEPRRRGGGRRAARGSPPDGGYRASRPVREAGRARQGGAGYPPAITCRRAATPAAADCTASSDCWLTPWAASALALSTRAWRSAACGWDARSFAIPAPCPPQG